MFVTISFSIHWKLFSQKRDAKLEQELVEKCDQNHGLRKADINHELDSRPFATSCCTLRHKT